MASKYQRRIAALRAKGFSREGAINHLRRATVAEVTMAVDANPTPVIKHRSPSDFVDQLRTTDVSSILIGRVSGGRSPDLALAIEQALQPERWFAKSRSVETMITQDEFVSLVQAGATERGHIQLVHVFPTEPGISFSFECASCQRYIWCGEQERSGTCVCHQRYEVRFDLPESWSGWKMALGWRCADCGFESALTQPKERRNPWRMFNEWQQQCNLCNEHHGNPSTYGPLVVSDHVGGAVVCSHCGDPAGDDHLEFVRGHAACESRDRERQQQLTRAAHRID